MQTAPWECLGHEQFTRSEARRRGINDKDLDRLVESGQARRVLQGVYQSSEVPDTIESRVKAVKLVMQPFSVVRDRTAAWLHGVDVLKYWELDIIPPLEVLSLADNTRMRRRGCHGARRSLDPEDVCFIDGVQATSPLRTSIDLARQLRRRDALAALDAFLRSELVTQEELRAALPRFRGLRGVVQARQLVAVADGRSESPGESWTRLAIIDAELPVPEPQLWVREGGRRVFRVDLGYQRCKVAVEYDGEAFHQAPEQKEHDLKRRAWLRERGWTVIVVDRDSFTPGALAAWLLELRAALPSR